MHTLLKSLSLHMWHEPSTDLLRVPVSQACDMPTSHAGCVDACDTRIPTNVAPRNFASSLNVKACEPVTSDSNLRSSVQNLSSATRGSPATRRKRRCQPETARLRTGSLARVYQTWKGAQQVGLPLADGGKQVERKQVIGDAESCDVAHI